MSKLNSETKTAINSFLYANHGRTLGRGNGTRDKAAEILAEVGAPAEKIAELLGGAVTAKDVRKDNAAAKKAEKAADPTSGLVPYTKTNGEVIFVSQKQADHYAEFAARAQARGEAKAETAPAAPAAPAKPRKQMAAQSVDATEMLRLLSENPQIVQLLRAAVAANS